MPQKPTLPSLVGKKVKKRQGEAPAQPALPAIGPTPDAAIPSTAPLQEVAPAPSLPSIAPIPESDAVVLDQQDAARPAGRGRLMTYDGVGSSSDALDLANIWRGSAEGVGDYANAAWTSIAERSSGTASTAGTASTSVRMRFSMPGQLSVGGLGGGGGGGSLVSSPSGNFDWRLAELRGVLAQELGAGFPASQWPPKSVPRKAVEGIHLKSFKAELLALKAGMPLTTLRHLLYSAPGALAVGGVLPRLAFLREACGVKDDVEAIDLLVRAPPLTLLGEKALAERGLHVTEALAKEGRNAEYVRELLRAYPSVLALRPQLLDYKLGLLRDVVRGVRPWRQELSMAPPQRLGGLLAASKRALLRLKFSVERGPAPMAMSTIVRWTDAEWGTKMPDFGAWEADFLALEAAEASLDSERISEWALLPLS